MPYYNYVITYRNKCIRIFTRLIITWRKRIINRSHLLSGERKYLRKSYTYPCTPKEHIYNIQHKNAANYTTSFHVLNANTCCLHNVFPQTLKHPHFLKSKPQKFQLTSIDLTVNFFQATRTFIEPWQFPIFSFSVTWKWEGDKITILPRKIRILGTLSTSTRVKISSMLNVPSKNRKWIISIVLACNFLDFDHANLYVTIKPVRQKYNKQCQYWMHRKLPTRLSNLPFRIILSAQFTFQYPQ